MWITAVGIAVAVAPIIWVPLAWDDGTYGSGSLFLLFLILFEALPFELAAVLRGCGQLSRVGGIVATIAASGWVVFGQGLGLNPNDPSSTASLALLFGPLYGIPSVALIWLLDRVAHAITSWRRALDERLGG